MTSKDTNSVAAIATKCAAAVGRPTVATVTAVAATTFSCVAAIAARSAITGRAASATENEVAGHHAAVATVTAISSEAAISCERRAAVYTRIAAIIDQPLLEHLLEAGVNDVVTSTKHNSIAATTTKRVAAISRPAVAAVAAVTAITSRNAAASATEATGGQIVSAGATNRNVVRHEAAFAAVAAKSSGAAKSSERRAAVTAGRALITINEQTRAGEVSARAD